MKNVHVETAELVEQDGQITEKPWLSHTITFDQGGRLIEQVNRNPDGSEFRTVNDYSDSGDLLTTVSYDPSGVLINELRYVYDEDGNLNAEHYITQDGKVTTAATYAYDSEGVKIKIQEYNLSGEVNLLISIEGTNTAIGASDVKRVETRYDGNSEAIEVKIFNTDGLLFCRVEIVRDATGGNPLEESQYVGDVYPFVPCASNPCATEAITELTEEQKAELAEEAAQLFSPGALISKHSHKYDMEGRLVESKLTMMGMEATHQIYTYDDFGIKSEEISCDADGKVASKVIFTREYDEHGNWTKELVSTKLDVDAGLGLLAPVHVTRRVLAYW